MSRSYCAPAVLSAPLFLETVYEKKSGIPSEFQTVLICWARSEPELSANVISRQRPPPLMKNPGSVGGIKAH